MNILFVEECFTLFGTYDSGGMIRSTMLLEALSKVGHVDVISFHGVVTSNMNNVDVVYADTLVSPDKGNRITKFLKLFTPWNPNYIYTVDRAKERIVDNQVKSKHYDYIAVRYVDSAVQCGLMKYGDKLLLDVDDNPQTKSKTLAKVAKRWRNKIYLYFLSYTLGLMTRILAQRVKVMYHSNIIQSPSPKSIYLPNISIHDVNIPLVDYRMVKPNILMVGLFDYFPNKIGADYFLRNVFPKIRQAMPEAQLHMVGRISDEDTHRRWSAIDGVTVHGFVENLLAAYMDCRAVVIPIYHGAGTCIKVLEAMQMNRPVVSSPYGMRGYEKFFEEGKDYLLGATNTQFAEYVIRLLQSEELNHQMASSAHQKLSKYFSKESFVEIVKDSLNMKIERL